MTASMLRPTLQAKGRPQAARLAAPAASGHCLPAQGLPAPWTWPFDALRTLQAAAVQAGWIRPSLLGSRDFERALAASERWLLGPWARRV